ncbi:hypothetical protein ECG_04012 [Echinococcus granulosus]|nr:hypothetical protein ECG_04012 [Echinococcus granulosus]
MRPISSELNNSESASTKAKANSSVDGNSLKSNTPRCYSYRKINGCSVVDSSLFGEPERLKAIKMMDRRKLYNQRGDDIKVNVFCNRRRATDCQIEKQHGKTIKTLLPESDRTRELIGNGTDS